MSTVGDLVVNLGLNSKSFDGGIERVRSQIAPLVTGLATLAGVGTFGVMTASAMKTVDETGELADTIGTTTEALVGLQHAASMGGGSAEGLTASLKKMLDNLGAAKQGAGSAVKLLDQFGLSAESLAAQDPSEVFVQLAEKISQLPTSADQASAAMDLFGKQGLEMLPMLASGAISPLKLG